ncbi:ABC transporter permease [Clostridium butyricum]|uniref:Taurine transport system permease protein TauC n=1 Tax=Clostridium butyricum E4 str. BoNT E BL5262 TaxID=632245 RepID=C4IJY2_CLOBU|nr:ABC transporter permease subunit [Clostridium butyricum]APF24678.1 binding--dependent transport system inner membrane component family protein [Clostridium butyricum]EDT74467.1 taurine transport system permease protein TauC [Clostridium butyricum 5521]EEP53388.1 taurine transport system permease protein TauC [Clostridium butyricum E4 str. BoNT E BL5262]KHD15993.1 taurine ABC transporter permease [Clostridium butyricum]MBZ0313324.1 ABC transporter permease subunit [Clostridium butyricum]
MSKKKKRITIENMLTLATIILILLVWFVVTNFGIANSKMVPTPQAVWNAFIDIIQNGYKNYSLLQHLGASMERLFISFFFAALIAVPFGLASGYNSKIRAIFEPIIEFYRPLPPLAYYTLLVLWLGIGNESKITLLFLACFAPIYISCVSAVLKIKEDYINSAYTVGASKYQIFIHVILPSCLPDIFVGIRTAVGVAYTTLVAAEMVAAKSGLGWMVLDASNYLRSDIIFVGIIIMGITGILLDQFLRILEKKIVPWKGKE